MIVNALDLLYTSLDFEINDTRFIKSNFEHIDSLRKTTFRYWDIWMTQPMSLNKYLCLLFIMCESSAVDIIVQVKQSFTINSYFYDILKLIQTINNLEPEKLKALENAVEVILSVDHLRSGKDSNLHFCIRRLYVYH